MLKLRVSTNPADNHRTDCLVCFVPEDSKAIKRALKRAGIHPAQLDFKGACKERLLLYGHERKRVMLAGLGKPDKVDLAMIRDAAAGAAEELAQREIKHPAFAPLDGLDQTVAAAEGALLGQYHFSRQEKPKHKSLTAVTLLAASAKMKRELESEARRLAAVAEGVYLARDLANMPPNEATPTMLVAVARKLSGGPIRVRALDRRACERLGMGSFLAVAQGSAQPPYLLVMEYRGAKGKPVAFVGKGVTFDSGGLSLKPAKSMEDMKNDMSGAAAVIGMFAALRRLKPRDHVVGIAPLTENMPGSRATRPGDVVTSMRGKTIEILNTDAEGRLILADALTYAARFKPRAIIDIATLTGAAVVALGSVRAAILATDDDLARDLERAGEATGERLWRMPMDEEYAKLIKSKIADVQNIASKPEAGTIIGGIFLKQFLQDEKTPWAHLDIAATAWGDQGSTGAGVRLFCQYLLDSHA